METLDRLFSEARNEAPETTLSDVQKWIVPMTLGALILAYFAKMKLIVTLKPFIMISSAILTVGIGAGTIFMLNTSTEHKPEKPVAAKHITTQTKQDPKPSETVVTPVITPSQTPVAEGEQQPVLRMLETWNDEQAYLPSLTYCQSLPSINTFIYKPYEPLKALRTMPAEDGQTTETAAFTTLKMWGAVDVVITQGDKYSYRIDEVTENENVNLHITNKGKVMEIYTDCKGNGKNKCNFSFTVYLTVVDLEKINCSGASSIKGEGKLNFGKLEIEITGASDLKLDLTTTDLKLNATGSSDLDMDLNAKNVDMSVMGASSVELEGSADNVKIANAGASDLDAKDFVIKKADVECAGASTLTINVSEELDVMATGASEVNIKGSPAKVTKDISGASEVKNIK